MYLFAIFKPCFLRFFMKVILWIGVCAILLGALLFGAQGALSFFSDDEIPLTIKTGSIAFLAGFIIIMLYLVIDRLKDIKGGGI